MMQKKLLYIGCSKFIKLSVVLRLYNLKVKNELSDKNFTALLGLLKDIIFEANKLSDRTYDARRYYALWVWIMRGYMFVLIIVFYTEKIMNVWRDV